MSSFYGIGISEQEVDALISAASKDLKATIDKELEALKTELLKGISEAEERSKNHIIFAKEEPTNQKTDDIWMVLEEIKPKPEPEPEQPQPEEPDPDPDPDVDSEDSNPDISKGESEDGDPEASKGDGGGDESADGGGGEETAAGGDDSGGPQE